MIKDNEKLNEFISNFMFKFDANYGFQLCGEFDPNHIAQAISGQFTDIKMNNGDLIDLITIGFTMAFAANKTLNGSNANDNDFKEWFEEYLELTM